MRPCTWAPAAARRTKRSTTASGSSAFASAGTGSLPASRWRRSTLQATAPLRMRLVRSPPPTRSRTNRRRSGRSFSTCLRRGCGHGSIRHVHADAADYPGAVPELPEVETVRRRLEPVLVGRTFERVEIFDPRLTRPFDRVEIAAELEGERVAAVDRRGKYLIVRFETGRALLIHLRMTGNVLHVKRGAPLAADPHRRAVVNLDDGSDVVYRDVRRFGTWLLAEPDEVESYLATRLGGEPLAAA